MSEGRRRLVVYFFVARISRRRTGAAERMRRNEETQSGRVNPRRQSGPRAVRGDDVDEIFPVEWLYHRCRRLFQYQNTARPRLWKGRPPGMDQRRPPWHPAIGETFLAHYMSYRFCVAAADGATWVHNRSAIPHGPVKRRRPASRDAGLTRSRPRDGANSN